MRSAKSRRAWSPRECRTVERRQDIADANQKLEDKAKEHGGRPEKTKPPAQPELRRPAPAKLRRVENLLVVPDAERACPDCGSARKCIAHETT